MTSVATADRDPVAARRPGGDVAREDGAVRAEARAADVQDPIRSPARYAAEQLSGERVGMAAVVALLEVERVGELPFDVTLDPPPLDDDRDRVVVPVVHLRDRPRRLEARAVLDEQPIAPRVDDVAVGRVRARAVRQRRAGGRRARGRTPSAVRCTTRPAGRPRSRRARRRAPRRRRAPGVSARGRETERDGVAARLRRSPTATFAVTGAPHSSHEEPGRHSGGIRGRSAGRPRGRRTPRPR